MKDFKLTIQEGFRHEIQLQAIVCGRDLSVTVCGGQKHHVGAVVLACGCLPDGSRPTYSATVSSLAVMDHKDDVVARKMAVYLADQLQINVTVTAGIHVDDASLDDLTCLQNNCMRACELLMQKLK